MAEMSLGELLDQLHDRIEELEAENAHLRDALQALCDEAVDYRDHSPALRRAVDAGYAALDVKGDRT